MEGRKERRGGERIVLEFKFCVAMGTFSKYNTRHRHRARNRAAICWDVSYQIFGWVGGRVPRVLSASKQQDDD